MAERPPSDSDDTWADVMKQVHDALDEAQIDGESLRKSLMDGVKQALESLDDFLVEPPTPDAAEPDERVPVVVVEGGRTDDQPITEGDIPQLHIAEDAVDNGDESPSESKKLDADEGPPALATTVRVFRSGLGPLPQSGEPQPSVPIPKVDLANVGHIALGPDAHRHQTLFRGDSPQIYRVHCDEGVMKVLVDGQPIETLQTGQSMDVSGRFLSIGMEEGGPVRGRYAWVAKAL